MPQDKNLDELSREGGEACAREGSNEEILGKTAVEHFQCEWNEDVDISGFVDMLKRSLGKVADVPGLPNKQFAEMIVSFAQADACKVRAMFSALFDETQDTDGRVGVFKNGADTLLKEYGNGAAQHYQDDAAVRVYLWLRYPEKYALCGATAGAGEVQGLGEGENSVDTGDAVGFDGEGATGFDARDVSGSDMEKGTADNAGFMQGADQDVYTKDRFLREVYMGEEEYNRLAALLGHKKNLILQGAPGVGKTFCAERLAWSIIGRKDSDRVRFVQFHQSYSYEDFVMGYRPCGEGFELRPGVFHRFCRRAAERPDEDFFFIIDEINRGNLSKIFGELLMLVECGYRGREMALAYNGEPFAVPENLYIVGMMNTADRSLAMIDYALRRRFAFFTMKPAFDSAGFMALQHRMDDAAFDALVAKLRELNDAISCDSSLGPGFCIGHSYLCGLSDLGGIPALRDRLREVVEYDILPTLSEYWFDNDDEFGRWAGELRGVFR